MALKLYYDLVSQPCRAVFIFLKVNNIPFDAKHVILQKSRNFSNISRSCFLLTGVFFILQNCISPMISKK